jgi:hypothetical protein
MQLAKPVLTLWGVTLILGVGCVTGAETPDSTLTLGPFAGFKKDRAFQRALRAEAGTPPEEKARIDYLLDRVSNSPYNFLRNGSRYTGIQAKGHFEWKYSLNRGQIKTAEDFINKVATRSKISGQSYLMEHPDGRRYLLRDLLITELERFNRALKEEREAPSAISLLLQSND